MNVESFVLHNREQHFRSVSGLVVWFSCHFVVSDYELGEREREAAVVALVVAIN